MIDRFFNYIISNKNSFLAVSDNKATNYLIVCLKRLEFDYTKEMIDTFTEESKEKIKIIIFYIKKLIEEDRKIIIDKITREQLINTYDNCKVIQLKNSNTNKRINNFFDYYYKSVIKEFEKAI